MHCPAAALSGSPAPDRAAICLMQLLMACLTPLVSTASVSPFAALPPGAPADYEVTLINVHEAAHSLAHGINDRGEICGTRRHADTSINRGVIHNSAGLQKNVDPADGYDGISILAINDSGNVAGFMETDAFVWSGGHFTILTPPDAAFTVARGINDSGTVVGDAIGPDGSFAWTWSSAHGYGTLKGLPGCTGHGAKGVNASGSVIGYSTRSAPGDPDTEVTSQWLYSGGSFTPVTWQGTTHLSLIGINDHGDLLILFRMAATGSQDRYAARSGNSTHELRFKLPPGLEKPAVSGFSNCGEITGYCSDNTGRHHAFRGRPAWLPELTETHADLAVSISGGQFRMDVSDSDLGAVYAPDRVLISAGSSARRLIPSGPAWSFLGAAGASTWILPQAQDPGLPWLGVSSIITGGVLQGPVAVSLDGVAGPGHFSLYSISGLGNPSVRMNSSDGINPATDRFTLNPGAHVHFNWAFSAPGLWKVRFRARGTPAAGGAEIVSTPQELTFWLEPGTVFPLFMGTPSVGQAGITIPLTAEVGRECVLRTSTDLVNWTISQQFMTTTREFTVTASTAGPIRFYRAEIR
jgi:surface-anchored protein